MRTLPHTFFGILICLLAGEIALADDAVTTQPSSGKTGELDLTFTERSPLSTKAELQRRLKLKDSAMGDDYDLSKCPFKAFVPADYDASVAYGVLVYLGYKDSTSVATPWEPALMKAHLIFITPVCHSGETHQPTVPMWESAGLAMDAVHNLRKQYNIDDKRLYQMAWNTGATQIALATSDVFTGNIVAFDQSWGQTIPAGKGAFYPANFASPPGRLYIDAKSHPFFLIADQGDAAETQQVTLKAGAMKREDFMHVMLVSLSAADDLHYPNMKPDWFEEKALPFLDKFATGSAKTTAVAAANPPAASEPTTAQSTTAVATTVPSKAQSLLSVAQILIANNQTELARTKLKAIISAYPTDPAAAKAKELLDKLDSQ